MIKRLDKTFVGEIVALQKEFKDGWTEQMFLSAFNGDFVAIGYFDDEKIVGVITLGISDVIDIESIFVAIEFRNKGIAKALMKEAVDLSVEKAKPLMLEVRESNLNALSLYKLFGFMEIARRKKYYFDGETAVVMKREIQK